MVLVVLTTLMISFIALFSQMVTAQTAKINNSENAFMQNMVTWHAGAVTLVHNSPPVALPAAGCVLEATAAIGLVACSSGAVPAANLPKGYSPNYEFYSAVFPSASGTYVLTFVCTNTLGGVAACKTDTNGFVQLPGGPGSVSTGFNPGDLMSQFKRAAPVSAAYGSVTTTGTFTQATPSINFGNNQTYTVPGTIPVGAVGIISPAN